MLEMFKLMRPERPESEIRERERRERRERRILAHRILEERGHYGGNDYSNY